MSSFGMVLIFMIVATGLYVLYHVMKVYIFLKWHDKHVVDITERAKCRKYNALPLWLKMDYEDIITQDQFDENMKYFEQNRDKNCGFLGYSLPAFSLFGESYPFLAGARAALLQLAHPMFSCICFRFVIYEVD